MEQYLSEFEIDGLRVEVEEGEAGLFYGTSPDEPGLLIAKQSRADVFKAAPQALAELRAVKAIDDL